MNIIWLIARRDFLARVRGKGYLFATVAGLLGILALNFAPAIGDWMTAERVITVAVVDSTARWLQPLQAQLPDKTGSGSLQFKVVAGSDRGSLDRRVQEGDLTGYLVIPPGLVAGEDAAVELVSEDSLRSTESARLQAALAATLTRLRLEDRGISEQEAAQLFSPPRLEATELGPTAGRGVGSESWVLTYVLVILLYITVLMYGSYIAMGVIEEKSSRVVEILISTVRPFQLMLGKVLGTGLAALVQYGVWVAAGVALLAARGLLGSITLGPVQITFSAVDPVVLAAFVLFFLLGFFTYAGLFAAGGSLVSRSEDAQQVTTPLSLFVVLVFFGGMYALGSPDAPLSVALSLIPLASPIVMFVRVAMGAPAAWEVALSVALSVAAILLLVALAARVFRAGVLLYGRRPGLRAVVKALR